MIATAIAALIVGTAMLTLSGSRGSAQTRGLAEEVAEELRAARQRAVSRQTFVAVAVPSGNGATGHSQSLYVLEGANTPRVVRSVRYQGSYPQACVFAGTWAGANGARPLTGSNSDAFSAADWNPPSPADYLLVFTPSGTVHSNGLPLFDGEYRLLTTQGVEFAQAAAPPGTGTTALSFFTPTRLSQPYTLRVSTAGTVTVEPGARGAAVATISSPLPTVSGPPPLDMASSSNSQPAIADVQIEPEPVSVPPGVAAVVAPGGYLSLTVLATDGDGDRLSLECVATGAGGGGRFSSPEPSLMTWDTQAQAWRGTWTWTPPDPMPIGETFRLECRVLDGRGGSASQLVGVGGQVRLQAQEKIAWTSTNDEEWEYEICTMNPDGTALKTITEKDDQSDGDAPSWSPDGTRLAYFAYNEDGDETLNVVNQDGSDPTVVAVSPWSQGFDIEWWAEGPSWSPDGAFLVVSMYDTNDYCQIYRVATNGSGKTRLTVPSTSRDDWQPQWNPVNDTIVFQRWPDSGSAFIATVSASGGAVTRLTNPPAGKDDYDPHWSLDGTRVLFSRDGVVYTTQVSNPEAEGGSLDQISQGTEATYPRYSPDGQWIAFIGGEYNLRYTRANGDHPVTGEPLRSVQLTGHGQVEGFCWGPDSDRLLVYRVGNRETLEIVALDGSREFITPPGYETWSVASWWGPSP